MQNSEIKIYKTSDGKTSIEVSLENDTVWLNQYQIEALFSTNRTTINKHILNIYKSGELDENSTCAFFAQVQKEGNRTVKRNIKYYNLDIIISVGYRVNSKRGTQFRIWANQILKEYLIKGYSLNQKRLEQQTKQFNELKETIKILGNTIEHKELSNDESKGLLKIISDYSYALDILDQYDYQSLKIDHTSKNEVYKISYKEAIKQIGLVKAAYGNSDLFGREKDESFKSSIATIYQTFSGLDLYPSIEEKAAKLLYFIVKNHSFSDGNKRIAAFLFLYFLEKNKLLFSESGKKRIADNAMVALTLMLSNKQTRRKRNYDKSNCKFNKPKESLTFLI